MWSTGAAGNSIQVSPESDTIYTVTGTSLGCITTAEALVTVEKTDHRSRKVGLPSDMYFDRITTAKGYMKLVPIVKN